MFVSAANKSKKRKQPWWSSGFILKMLPKQLEVQQQQFDNHSPRINVLIKIKFSKEKKKKLM